MIAGRDEAPSNEPRYTCEYCGFRTAVIVPREFHRARIVVMIIEAIVLYPVAVISIPLLILLCNPATWIYIPALPLTLIEVENWEETFGVACAEGYGYLIGITLLYICAVIGAAFSPPYSTPRKIKCLQCGWEKRLW